MAGKRIVPHPDIVRGQVIFVDLDGARGAEKKNDPQSGGRPCIVVQNDIANRKSDLTVVVPVTDMKQYKGLPFQIKIKVDDSFQGVLDKDCVADCGHIRSIDKKSRILDKFGVLPASVMEEVDKGVREILGLTNLPPSPAEQPGDEQGDQ